MSRKKSPNGTGRQGRDKKKRAIESEEYKENIKELAKQQVTADDIESIYYRCQEKPQTKIARDTLAVKLLALLNYFNERNEGIEEYNQAYINKEDVIEMILKNPRIMNSDINNNIIAKCQAITGKKENDVRAANIAIKSNPGIFRKTMKNIIEGK